MLEGVVDLNAGGAGLIPTSKVPIRLSLSCIFFYILRYHWLAMKEMIKIWIPNIRL